MKKTSGNIYVQASGTRKLINKQNQKLMKRFLFFIGLALVTIVLAILAIFIAETSISKGQTDPTANKTKEENILISQYDLKKDYGWQDIILWNESKENFEKAYNTKLNWINYPMGFKKDPSCISPVGGDDWIYDKICYQYVVPLSNPHMIDSIAKLSKGKTLVIIGTTHNNMQNFYGNAYWY